MKGAIYGYHFKSFNAFNDCFIISSGVAMGKLSSSL
jgi:hypothetical protein